MANDGTPRDAWLEWHTVDVAGRRAEYGIAGDATQPTVVFLHGWALSNRTYKAALARLVARGLRVVAPALPGHGGTASLPRAADLDDFATWVDDFLEAVAIGKPVTLVGHSFGGGVAIRVAHDFPERVHALVLVDSIGGSAWREHDSVLQTMKSRPLWDWGLHFQRDIFPIRQVQRVLPVILHDAFVNAVKNPTAVWHAAQIARTADLTAELEELKARGLPVVVLWGTRDRIIGKLSIDSLVAAVGATDVRTIDGSHSWLLNDPDAFGEIMTNVVAVDEAADAAEAFEA